MKKFIIFVLALNLTLLTLSACDNLQQEESAEIIPTENSYTAMDGEIEIEIPDDYILQEGTEENRRGSVEYYDFKAEDFKTPILAEIQFFTEESIAKFEEKCESMSLCFEGDYPTPASYSEELEAFEKNADLSESTTKLVNGRKYFVTNSRVAGDSGFVRQYTSFVDDVKIDLWVFMSDESQSAQADKLVEQIEIQ